MPLDDANFLLTCLLNSGSGLSGVSNINWSAVAAANNYSHPGTGRNRFTKLKKNFEASVKAGSFDAGDEKPEKKPVMNGSDSGETGTTATPSPKKGGRGNGKKRGRPVKEVYNDYDGDGNGNEEWMEGTPKKPRNGSTGGDRRAKVRVEKPVVEEDEGSDGAFGESIYV